MIFTPSVSDDINRYYKNTYVKFKETGEKLFYIKSVSNSIVTGMDEEGNAFELWLSEEHPYEVDFSLPRKSYFQYKDRALILERIPAKQYQRGVSEANTKMYGLGREGQWQNFGINFETLGAFVTKQKFFSLEEVLKAEKGMKSMALSPRFAVSLGDLVVYVDTFAVAKLSKKGKALIILQKLFSNELSEFAKTSNLKVVYE